MKTLFELRGNKYKEEVTKVLGISIEALTAYEELIREPRDEVKARMFEFYGTNKIIFSSKDLENRKEQRLNLAARELSDEIYEIKLKLEKAEIILQELLEEYFERYDNKEMDEHLWEFKRNEIYANIIADYVYEARDIIDKLKQRAETPKEENDKVA